MILDNDGNVVTDPPCWLIHARLYDKLAAALGQYFVPLDDAFLAALPEPEGTQPARDMYAEAERRDARIKRARYSKRKVAA